MSVAKIRIDRLGKTFGEDAAQVRALQDFTLTVNDGMSTRRPFTFTCPWRTNWRDCARDVPKPIRYSVLSRRRSSMLSMFAPVMPFMPLAFSNRLRNWFSKS